MAGSAPPVARAFVRLFSGGQPEPEPLDPFPVTCPPSSKPNSVGEGVGLPDPFLHLVLQSCLNE